MAEHRQELILDTVRSFRRLPRRMFRGMQLGAFDGQRRTMRDQADKIKVVVSEFARYFRTHMNYADHPFGDLQRCADQRLYPLTQPRTGYLHFGQVIKNQPRIAGRDSSRGAAADWNLNPGFGVFRDTHRS